MNKPKTLTSPEQDERQSSEHTVESKKISSCETNSSFEQNSSSKTKLEATST